MIEPKPSRSLHRRENAEHELNNLVILEFVLLGMGLIFATLCFSVYFTIQV